MPKTRRYLFAGYIPAIHSGYLRMFEAFPEVEELYVFSNNLLASEKYLKKELRALQPSEQLEVIKKLARFKKVNFLDEVMISRIDKAATTIIMPDEDISHKVAKSFKSAKVEYYPVFLRWDRRAVEKPHIITPDKTISNTDFRQKMMKLASSEGLRSSNIWRRVGAVVVKDKKILLKGSNRHMPTDYSIWLDGDPRSLLQQGVGLEITTDMHAEALLIAQAAKKGLSLTNAEIYVSTFPCPNCAKLIAEAGFKACYYSGNYAVLDGETVLKSRNVQLIHIDIPEAEGHPKTWVPYKK